MPVRSRELGPEVGRGLHSAAGREVGGAVAKVPAAAVAPAHFSHLARPFPSRPCTRSQLGCPVHLQGGDSPHSPPPRPAHNKGGGGGDSCQRRPPPGSGPASPRHQPRGRAAPAPRSARTHPGRAGGVAANGDKGCGPAFNAPPALPLQPPQRGPLRPCEDTWWEGRGGRDRGC